MADEAVLNTKNLPLPRKGQSIRLLKNKNKDKDRRNDIGTERIRKKGKIGGGGGGWRGDKGG